MSQAVCVFIFISAKQASVVRSRQNHDYGVCLHNRHIFVAEIFQNRNMRNFFSKET